MSSPKPYSAPLNFSCNLVYDQKPAKQMTSLHLQMHSLFKGTICKKWPPDKILFKQTNFTVYFTSCSVQSMVNIRIFLSILQYFDNFTPHVIQFLVMLINLSLILSSQRAWAPLCSSSNPEGFDICQ